MKINNPGYDSLHKATSLNLQGKWNLQKHLLDKLLTTTGTDYLEKGLPAVKMLITNSDYC